MIVKNASFQRHLTICSSLSYACTETMRGSKTVLGSRYLGTYRLPFPELSINDEECPSHCAELCVGDWLVSALPDSVVPVNEYSMVLTVPLTFDLKLAWRSWLYVLGSLHSRRLLSHD